MDSVFPVLLVGFVLGMRHATDPDHVVAVTTIVSRKPEARAALSIGALWGLGHTFTILLVGGAIILFGVVIPPHLGLGMEFAVSLVLVALGALNLVGLPLRFGGSGLAHDAASRGEHAATAGHTHSISTSRAWLGRGRPLAVGLVHGLAGSAAIALFVLATIRDARWALLYLLLFGAGTLAGMMLITTAFAVPMAAAARRNTSVGGALVRATGAVSLLFGLFLAYRIGVVDGLFSAHPIWDPH